MVGHHAGTCGNGICAGRRTYFERASGIQRLANFEMYHGLFRGLPWPLFRYGGFIRIFGLVVILYLCGWQAAVASVIAIFILSFALRAIATRHALTMLEQVGKES